MSSSKVTVALTSRSVDALNEITRLTGDNTTQAINKALQVYALIQRGQHAGGGIRVQESADAVPVPSRFI